MSKTFATLFSCAGCVDRLMIDNGYRHVYANEYNPELAAIYSLNHQVSVSTRDFLEVRDGNRFKGLDWLHASPPCVTFSGARSKKVSQEEEKHEIALSRNVARFAKDSKAKFVSIENVKAYFRSTAFFTLATEMTRLGYKRQLISINARDCGLNQFRLRGFAFFWKDESNIPKLTTNLATSNKDGWASMVDVASLPELIVKPGTLVTPLERIAALDTPEYPVAVALVNYRKSSTATEADQALPCILASLADDSKGANGRSRFIMVQTADGEYKNMTAEALKIFQGFPSDFKLSGNNRVDVRAIGNACPPHMLEKAIRDSLSSIC